MQTHSATTSRIKIAYRKTKSIDICRIIDSLSRDISLACVNIITPHFDVNNISARFNSTYFTKFTKYTRSSLLKSDNISP